MKRCLRCDTDKPLDQFAINRARKDGRHYYCKACEKARKAEYYKRNREKVRASNKQWFADNPGARAKHSRRKRESDREAYRAYFRRWYDSDQGRALRRKNESSRRARKHAAFVEAIDPRAVFERSGGICGICGKPVSGDFHVDHIVPLACGGAHAYSNVQAAHPFCNGSKGARMEVV